MIPPFVMHDGCHDPSASQPRGSKGCPALTPAVNGKGALPALLGVTVVGGSPGMSEAPDKPVAPQEPVDAGAPSLQEFIRQGNQEEQRAHGEGYREWTEQEWEDWNNWRWRPAS